jgi:diguanylate cyclase (GGDEF)-like protein/PAS domain S-box-containing protein
MRGTVLVAVRGEATRGEMGDPAQGDNAADVGIAGVETGSDGVHVGAGASSFTVDGTSLAALLTHIDAVVLTYAGDGTITFVSNGVRELLGFEPEALVGRAIFDFVHPDDAARLGDNLTRWAGRDGITLDDDIRALTSTGGWVDVALESVNGAAVAPFGAGVATLRATGDSTSIEQQLRHRLANEDRLIRLARAFVGESGDFDRCVRQALDEMGSLEGVDSIGIWVADDRGLVHHRYQWTAPSIPSTLGLWPPFPPGSTAFGAALQRLEEVVIRASDTDHAGDPDGSGREVDELRAWGGKAFLAVPMVSDGAFSGFVSFSSHRDENIFAPTHLATLRAAAGILAEAFARSRAQARIEHQARHDSLTGLVNRWVFSDSLRAAVDRVASGASVGVAVLLLDIDRFAIINDSLGHTVGDEVLVAVSGRLVGQLRPTESLARFGGDELVLLLDDVASAEAAVARAEEIARVFRDPFRIGASELRVSASVGVAHCSQGCDPELVVREADTAMYTAKVRGGRQVAFFDETLRSRTTTRHEREHDLHGALERGELELYYQPEFDLESQSIVGVEALLRWRHPRHGFLAAGEFIEIAEDSGIIVEIGDWVLGEGMRQLAAWRAAGLDPGVVMRINLSARQTAEAGLAGRVAALADEAAADPAAVCFELTETAVMTDPTHALDVLEGLHEQGFSIAIDDFGTGYSSLAYLRDLPVDVLKIDRAFVAELDRPHDQTLVRTMLSMAESLGLDATAEGIETQGQLDALRRLGCRRGQGFLLALPAPEAELRPVLGLT